MKLSRALGVLLCIVACSFANVSSLRAEPVRTALVLAPRSDDPALVEVTARVRGELSAAGFRVLTREAPEGVSAERAVAVAGADLSPSAVLWIVAANNHSQAAPSLEIWLSDRLLGKVSMARLSGSAEQGETPSVLAVQAVELLRARISELRVGGADEPASLDGKSAPAWIERPASGADASSADAHNDTPPIAPSRKRERPWLGVSLGLGYLFGSGSLSGAMLPVLGVSVSLGEPRADAPPLTCDFRVSAGAFGQEQQFSEQHGSVRVDQAFGTFQAALRVVPPFPIEPFIGLGVGVYSLGVRGQAEAPFQAHDPRYWAPTGSVSAGLRSRPFAHLSLLASGELIQAFSRAEVHVADTLAARAGGAMWLLRAELMGVF